MEVNCIIIEDERPAIEILTHYISRVDFLKLKGAYQNPVLSMPMTNAENIDLIFLDINLPAMSGLDFIRTANPSAGIILTTAHAEFAVSSFELEVVDFLLKPFPYDRFLKAVNRFLKLRKLAQIPQEAESKKDHGFIFVKSNKRMVKVVLNDILYIEAQKNYLMIVTGHEQLLCYQSISVMADRLPKDLFLRVHRSYIAGLYHLDGFTHASVTINKKEIPIGKKYSKEVYRVLQSRARGAGT
jgi:DNA-binding LytR/AlgR family response regulator